MKASEQIVYRIIESPIGMLTIAADKHGLRHIEFPSNRHAADRSQWQKLESQTMPVLINAQQQLDDYFCGRRKEFDLPLAPVGTHFQQMVWNTLRQIPYGQTWSYRDLAQAIGKPAAVRAVGAANGRNPLPIILPCHRVIGANGSLTGFGGGIETKARLLKLEANHH